MKTKVEKKVNRRVRQFNRELQRDVFGGRFEVRQLQKARVDGLSWFLYELIDHKQPEGNTIVNGWVNEFDFMRRIWTEMNDFIVYSNFWSIYYDKPDTYNKEHDKFLK